jgi:hypothetical protein
VMRVPKRFSPPRATTTPCMLIVASVRVSFARDARRELCRARATPTPQNQDRSIVSVSDRP